MFGQQHGIRRGGPLPAMESLQGASRAHRASDQKPSDDAFGTIVTPQNWWLSTV